MLTKNLFYYFELVIFNKVTESVRNVLAYAFSNFGIVNTLQYKRYFVDFFSVTKCL